MPSRCADSPMCMRDPDCEDEHCPGRPKPGPCSACRRAGACITPTACQQPEPAPPARPRTFRPTFELRGPFRAKKLRPRGWPVYRLFGAFLLLALVLSVLLPYFHR